MRWSPSMMSKLGRVRELRIHMAETELSRADHALTQCKRAEEQTRQSLAATTERSAAEAAQADKALLTHALGGRRGISEWQTARKRAQSAVQTARGKVDEAVSDRVDKELQSSTVRGRWRDARFEMERLRLLAERMSENGG